MLNVSNLSKLYLTAGDQREPAISNITLSFVPKGGEHIFKEKITIILSIIILQKLQFFLRDVHDDHLRNHLQRMF